MKIVKVTEADLVKVAAINPKIADLIRQMSAEGANTSFEKQFGIDIVLFNTETLPVDDTKPEDPIKPPEVVTNSNDFNGITNWHGKSRGTWKETVKISNVRVEGGNIAWNEAPGQRDHWNIMKGRKTVNGETNLIVPEVSAAGCFDYLGVGQTRKITSNLNYKDAHEPGFFHPWHPKKGDKVGFYISTINRHPSHFKMQERSNVVWFIWP